MLIKKMQDLGKTVAVTPEGIEVMSEIIENFAEPLLVGCKNDKDIKNSIRFAILIWNLTLLSEDEQKNKIQELVETLSTPNNIDEINNSRYYIDLLINRKKESFSHIKRAIIDYQFSGADSSLRLDVASENIRE
ncbi:MAG: hypothetical protein HQK78_08990 [Desulfobacterales bacterium]|nr:hypothetical protein [Desulfobacterales bacterium]